MKQLPRVQRFRPDFMAPSPRVLIESGDLTLTKEDDIDTDDEETDLVFSSPSRMRYYESHKACGYLFRDIDEHQFLNDLRRPLPLTKKCHGAKDPMTALWDHIQRSTILLAWNHHLDTARDIRAWYEAEVSRILEQYRPSPHSNLTEHELFAGCVLGRAGGKSSKALRELTKTMREQFEGVLSYAVECMTKGDEYDGYETRDEYEVFEKAIEKDTERLPRALACLEIGMTEEAEVEGYGRRGVNSWRYVAAGVVLKEMRKAGLWH